MAWDKSSYTVMLGTSCTTKTTVNTNSSACADYDVNGATEYMVTAVRVSVDYPAAPNAEAEVAIYARDTDKCNLPDTMAMFEATIEPPTTSGEGIATYQVNVSALDHIRVCVTNPDLTNSVEVLVTAMSGWG